MINKARKYIFDRAGIQSYFYYQNSKYYRKKFNEEYDSLSEYLKLIRKKKKLNNIESSNPIKEKQFEESNIKRYLKKLGSPFLSHRINKEDLKIEIKLFKSYLGGMKTRHEVHIANGKIFLIRYVFNQIDLSERDEIIRNTKRKIRQRKSRLFQRITD